LSSLVPATPIWAVDLQAGRRGRVPAVRDVRPGPVALAPALDWDYTGDGRPRIIRAA